MTLSDQVLHVVTTKRGIIQSINVRKSNRNGFIDGWGVKPRMAPPPSQQGYDREIEGESEKKNDTKMRWKKLYYIMPQC